MQDSITLTGASDTKINKRSDIMKLRNHLDERYIEWMTKQKNHLNSKVRRHEEESVRVQEKNQCLLSITKTWKGPCTTIDELDYAINNFAKNENVLKKILKTEIKFRKITSPNDSVERPNLFKLNKLSTKQLEQNLRMILSTKFADFVEVPDEDEGLKLIMLAFD